MAKTWVLDTETKGTGAHVEPLRSGARGAEPPLNLVRFRAPARPAGDAEEASLPPAPRRFKVIDVLSSSVLAQDVEAAGALAALAHLHKPVDARVYVWEPGAGRWRLLTLGETRSLWELRERTAAAAG